VISWLFALSNGFLLFVSSGQHIDYPQEKLLLVRTTTTGGADNLLVTGTDGTRRAVYVGRKLGIIQKVRANQVLSEFSEKAREVPTAISV